MYKFKAGDIVKQTRDCSETIAGKIYVVRYNDGRPNEVGDGEILTIGWNPKTQQGCQCQSYWKPATKEEYQIYKLTE